MGLKNLFKKFSKKQTEQSNSSDAAKERLHMVLMQDRANVSADYIDMMKQEIIDDIKKYIDVDEKEIDLRLTNQIKNDGSNGAPALFANIPITTLKNEKKNLDNEQYNGNNKDDKDVIKNSILNIKSPKKTSSKKVEKNNTSEESTLNQDINILQTKKIKELKEKNESSDTTKKAATTRKRVAKKVEEVVNHPEVEKAEEKSTVKKTTSKTRATSATKKAKVSSEDEEKPKVTKAKKTTRVTASKK